jgi:hypothetical protein
MPKSVMRVLWALVLLMYLCSLGAGAQLTGRPKGSAREFVESFYQWYVPRAHSETADRPCEIALKYKRSAFSSQLAELMREDSTAQARCKDSVGINWDPFLNYQEVADRYLVGRITQKGQTYMADIYAVWAGEQRQKPDVTAEFVEKDGHWFFVNFHYPDGGDLLTTLKSPRRPCSRPRASSNK